MSIVIGIDIGATNTKIVGLNNGKVFSPVQIRATDAVSSVYGAFGKFIASNNMQLSDIEKIIITGVGADAVKDDIFGVPTSKIEEFTAVGMGGLFLAGKNRALIASMGTGTAFILAEENYAKHLGGTGVGGGTLTGMAKQMLGMSRVKDVIDIAENGDLSKIDIMVSELTTANIETLAPNVTAANFAKMSDFAEKSDIALGLINMICQTIGMMASFAAKSVNCDTAILTGYLSKLPQAERFFGDIERITGLKFVIPDKSEFATAIGAAISYINTNA